MPNRLGWLPKFQFTHPGGVRPNSGASQSARALFQFTHPGGVRLNASIASSHSPPFQFTHPGGVRLRRLSRPPLYP